MTGAKSPAPILTPELAANVILENDRPEFHYLGASQLMTAIASFEDTLTNDTFSIQFTVPQGSLHVVEYASVALHHSAAADACCNAWVDFAGTSGLVSAGSVTAFATDARWGGRSLLGISSLSTFAPGAVVDHFDAVSPLAPFANTVTLLHRGYPIIAGPGQQWGITVYAADATFSVVEIVVNFRVRAIEPSEARD